MRRVRSLREDMPGRNDNGIICGRQVVKQKKWYSRLWIWSIAYFALGFFNILFAWLGLLDFLIPLVIAAAGGGKWFCNNMCGRGQLFNVLGSSLKISRGKPTPKAISSRAFRLAFLAFFLTMFAAMVFQTYLVASGAESLRQAIKLLWTFRVPWSFAYQPGILPEGLEWIAQFAFGFYSMMLTSTIIGLIFMAAYRPRSWCTFCPMGTMTQEICRLKAGAKKPHDGK